ncbi:DUF5317 family protein [uncultured Cellulomonas sp.]|uniref:DUF5317 family protein n=1 Tax=uncultured Cellulomonas sp. TaxID=189682 RepID=UPI0028EA1A67|nr:DUF5317 family protein [uncultured Cellulomonas sp.]
MSRGLLIVLLVAPVVALAVLAARRGGLAGLSRVRLRGTAWVLLAAAVQALRSSDPGWTDAASPWWPLVLACCAVGFAWANGRVASTGVRVALGTFAAGVLANAVTTAVNGGMPFSVSGARLAGLSEAAIASPAPGHVPIADGTRLVALADVLPVPGLHVVLSVGDLLLWAGLVGLLVAAAAATSRLPGRAAGAHHHPVDDSGVFVHALERTSP